MFQAQPSSAQCARVHRCMDGWAEEGRDAGTLEERKETLKWQNVTRERSEERDTDAESRGASTQISGQWRQFNRQSFGLITRK